MPTWSRFHFPISYTVSVSRLVINAECCTLTIDLMHCGVRFLLCEVFNYTFPLLTVHVLVFELYPATPRHCPDHVCLLRLRCILTWKLASASMLFQEILVRQSILVGSTILASSSEMLDLLAEIWSSFPVLSSIPGNWPPYSLLAMSSWNRYKVQIVSCIAELLQMRGLAFLELFVLLSTLLILENKTHQETRRMDEEHIEQYIMYFFTGNSIYLFVCSYILLCISWMSVIIILFINLCRCVSWCISLCKQGILILWPRML